MAQENETRLLIPVTCHAHISIIVSSDIASGNHLPSLVFRIVAVSDGYPVTVIIVFSQFSGFQDRVEIFRIGLLGGNSGGRRPLGGHVRGFVRVGGETWGSGEILGEILGVDWGFFFARELKKYYDRHPSGRPRTARGGRRAPLPRAGP